MVDWTFAKKYDKRSHTLAHHCCILISSWGRLQCGNNPICATNDWVTLNQKRWLIGHLQRIMKSCVTHLDCNHRVWKKVLQMLIMQPVIPSLHHCCNRSVELHCGNNPSSAANDWVTFNHKRWLIGHLQRIMKSCVTHLDCNQYTCLDESVLDANHARNPFIASLLQSQCCTPLRQKSRVCRLQWMRSHDWMEVFQRGIQNAIPKDD